MHRPQPPSKVKVGPHTYSLKKKNLSDLPLVDGEKVNAYLDKDKLLVEVGKRLKLSKEQELVLHEFLHSVWPEGYSFEEEIILALTPKLLHLGQDNPELITYLFNRS